MMRRRVGAAAALAAVLAVTAACGGSSKPSTSATGGTSNQTVTVGVLADITGPAASVNKTSVAGIKAGVRYASRQGYTIRYIVGDTATNPNTVLSVAQKFVTQDHVTAVLAESSLTFLASSYLTAHNVPVVGIGEDGPEWITAKNMFSVVGALHTTKVATTSGEFFKKMGVTNLGIIGYAGLPASTDVAKATALSAEAAGVHVGYLNATLPLGTTDVGPMVLAMKNAGVDGFTGTIVPDTAFALITGLRQQGVNLKVALLPTGYGGDLLEAGPGAIAAAQNVYFLVNAEPIEMQTAATRTFQTDLASTGTAAAATTFAMYNGYVSVGLLVEGLKKAGAKPTSASLIASLSNIHDFTALGLYGTHKLDVNNREDTINGVDNCIWVTQFRGSTFHVVDGAAPICGATLAGRTVS
ncbi:ABC transporter substrate-binding protein [Frankia sp. AgB1.9]|uniref:ABC transporter substrate-binding protein n=1 Tax=unclassified Frankia TaxID=2632575 RepID=UPI001933FE23|nr:MULTISPECIES: ABC transporter substrate-binding protein [unclassified Frankia]MBL7488508.1 ABC transporter substrate-binding protein [Frankia sp. AgW1.1]MBL7547291.1 ABC transporter substrate-binding protein [Frankia sp. AgB1.9]MBL7620804.1 ABC transporter substrate-binding protein [Frankia sp. AgB1.8]